MRTIGHVDRLFRYPVKSMAGEPLDAAQLGWHGLPGDRRFALRRLEDAGGKPWLTASKLPELVRFTPLVGADDLVTHVRTPDGRELAVTGDDLAAEITRLHGKPVQMMHLAHGIFDEGTVSVIATSTIREIGTACGRELDVLRFRPNILLRTEGPPFEEDGWVGGILAFGDDGTGPELSVTLRDERCAMLNLDHTSAESDPKVLKAVVRMNDNKAGVYATVIRTGRLAVGQRVHLRPGE